MEYRFELSLCAALERQGRIVARQLGAAVDVPGSRIVDICLLEPGPRFDDRAAITTDTIPPTAIESDVGPGTAIPITDAIDRSPEVARRVVERAVDVGYFEHDRRDGDVCVRATTRYPDDWFDSLVAIENKPDLGTPGDLEQQLRFDIALGLFEEVYLATESYVTRAHLNRIPEKVGVWRFDPETGEREVVREADSMAVDEPGVEIRAEHGLRTDVAVVSPAAKARKRRRIAERAYGNGWRPTPPACGAATTTADGRPYCTEYGQVVDPGADCGADCPGYTAAAPPETDHDALRNDRSAWVADTAVLQRRQAGLDQFLESE